MKKLVFLIAIVALCSCTSKEEVKPVEVNNFINKAFEYSNGFSTYTLEFTTDSECKQSSPKFTGGGYHIEFMSYSYSGNEGVIDSPSDDCYSHKVRLSGDVLYLTHSNDHVNEYKRIK